MKLAILLLASTFASAATKPSVLALQPSNPLARGLVRYYAAGADPTVMVDYVSALNLACSGLVVVGSEYSSTGSGACKGSDAGLPAGLNAPFSIAVLLETSASLAAGSEQDIVSWGDASVNANAMVIGQLNIDIWGPPNMLFAEGYRGLLGSSAILAPGVWTRATFVYDGQMLTLYVDGLPVSSQMPANGINLALTGAITLGVRNDGTRPWSGGVGDAAIWNRALSAAEVASDFADPWQEVRPLVVCSVGGVASPCPSFVGPMGPAGPQGEQGPPGTPSLGTLALNCATQPCISVGAPQMLIAEQDGVLAAADGSYTVAGFPTSTTVLQVFVAGVKQATSTYTVAGLRVVPAAGVAWAGSVDILVAGY